LQKQYYSTIDSSSSSSRPTLAAVLNSLLHTALTHNLNLRTLYITCYIYNDNLKNNDNVQSLQIEIMEVVAIACQPSPTTHILAYYRLSPHTHMLLCSNKLNILLLLLLLSIWLLIIF
jgi:hypothetical protein